MKRKICRICAVILILLLMFAAGDIWMSAEWLKVREYEFSIKNVENNVRFVVISDLHDHEFGKENRRLVKKVRKQKPDFVLLAGDFLNEDSENADIACGVIESLSEFAPVYFVLGNDEKVYMEKKDPELIKKLETAGADVLEEKYVDFNINGTALRLGGLSAYAFGPDGKASTVAGETKEFLTKFQDTGRVKIMMSHRPDSFIFGDASSFWNIDLTVSGHTHGGQVAIPFCGGLYGGDQGWFPKYVHGKYQKGQMQLFITSGLGNGERIVPRFHNLPEIAVITIQAKKQT